MAIRDAFAERLLAGKPEATAPAPVDPVEVAAVGELAEAKARFRDMDAAARKNIAANMDGEFFCCLVFESKAERDACVSLLDVGSFDPGTRWRCHATDWRYLNGQQFLRRLRARGRTK